MLGSRTPSTITPPDNGKQFVDSIAPYLDSVDICFGNLEGVFVNEDVKPQKCSESSRKAHRCYEFGMPDTLAYTLQQLNVNIVSMDNNHNSDYGWKGVSHTKNHLDQYNIKYAAKKSPVKITLTSKNDSTTITKDSILIDSIWCQRTTTITIEQIDTVTIVFVAFGHSSISYHVGDLQNTKEVIEELSKQYEIVVVSFHGGAEGLSAQHVKDTNETYYGENRGNIYRFAHTAIDAGADLIIGHGPHVLRAIELYNNRLICYSLGNFLTYGNVNIKGLKGLGAIMDIEINNQTGEFESGRIIATRQVGRGIPTPDDSKESIGVIKKLTEVDFPNGNLIFEEDGSIHK